MPYTIETAEYDRITFKTVSECTTLVEARWRNPEEALYVYSRAPIIGYAQSRAGIQYGGVSGYRGSNNRGSPVIPCIVKGGK